MPTAASGAEPNRYAVSTLADGEGWRVRIIGPSDREVSSRACRDESEARAYESTVRQHIGWLSEAKFREYYRLPEEG